METVPGSGRFHNVPNPVTLEQVDAALGALRPSAGSFVSLTGGEPLLQPEAVGALAARVRERGLRPYLETHGLAVAALESVVDRIDVVSMDWKLASDVEGAPGEAERNFGELHQEFLALARRAGEVFVKVVVTPNTQTEEIETVCQRMAEIAPDAPLILQPVTPKGRIRESPDAAQLLAWLRASEALHADVRLIPQTHLSYGAL